MIRLPLELLKLDHIFTWEDLSYLLCNRNLFGANKEFNYRSSLDADLRSSGIYQISLKDLSNNKKFYSHARYLFSFLNVLISLLIREKVIKNLLTGLE